MNAARHTIKSLGDASQQITDYLKWERETIQDFHDFAQMFGGTPGGNVYLFGLTEALKHHGLTLEQFRAMRRP